MMSDGSSDQMAIFSRLFHPNILLYCDFDALINFIFLSEYAHKQSVASEKAITGYWPALCNSYCAKYGLYSHVMIQPDLVLSLNYKQHLFQVLMPFKTKWLTTDRDNHTHKIRAACRFRPGEQPVGKVCLPLHQFIKVKRKQQQGDQVSAHGKDKLFVGEEDPAEFKDPFLGTLMRDPVLLLTSNRVVDRAVAVQCVLRGGRDPFNNKKLTMQHLQPQPDLARRIQGWRDRPGQRDVSVDMQDLKGLVNCASFDADCFDALLELQHLHAASQKAKVEAMQPGASTWDGVDFVPDTPVAAVIEVQEDAMAPQTDDTIPPNALQTDVQDVLQPAHILEQEDLLHSQRVGYRESKEAPRIVEVNGPSAFVSMHVPGSGVQAFHYHAVYDPKAGQSNIYDGAVQDAVVSALNGCNACVFCYGQTGSGKTYTFLGPEGHLDSLEGQMAIKDAGSNTSKQPSAFLPTESGVALRAAQELFVAQEALQRSQNVRLTCSVQIVEIYEEKVTDLLTGALVQVRRDTGHVSGGSEHICTNMADLLGIMKTAHSRQRFAETSMNTRSSRAHTVLIWHLTQHKEGLVVQSQLHMVDLAGSERVKKSQVTGQHLREAVGINSSLLVLGKVITALEKQLSHVPYLECKLTTLLKAAFGGNSRTTVIVNARSDEEYGDETLQSLRFGWRCGQISNQLKNRAMSLESTLEAIDSTLKGIRTQLEVLQGKNKTHMESYKTLQQSYELMLLKRKELLATHNKKAKGGLDNAKTCGEVTESGYGVGKENEMQGVGVEDGVMQSVVEAL
ncbi:hypothetical protein EON64_10915 [archaeon]|nr:MAG: hypothetical protein EON64_10915 [archaeon]